MKKDIHSIEISGSLRRESYHIFLLKNPVELLPEYVSLEIISSFEYNYSVPGGLKNAIDWTSRGEDSPLSKKPVSKPWKT